MNFIEDFEAAKKQFIEIFGNQFEEFSENSLDYSLSGKLMLLVALYECTALSDDVFYKILKIDGRYLIFFTNRHNGFTTQRFKRYFKFQCRIVFLSHNRSLFGANILS